jgi:hypothetical protein
MLTRRHTLIATSAWAALPILSTTALGNQRPDTELVLAVDISMSMTAEEGLHQRQAYLKALASAEVRRAIASTATASIGLAYMEWAGPDAQFVILPMTVIDSPLALAGALRFLAETPIRSEPYTAIGAALLKAQTLFSGMAQREVIDISGDGQQSAHQGPDVASISLMRGVTVNALPMVSPAEPGLAEWYRQAVTSRFGGFCLPFDGSIPLDRIIAMKISSEIAGIIPDGAQRGIA